MRQKLEQQVVLILTILSLIVGLFVVSSVSSLRTGLGFGKDTTYLIDTRNLRELEDFLEAEYHDQHDISVQNVVNNLYLVKISGVDKSDEFKQALQSSVPNTSIRLEGSFGSLVRLNNNESFMKSSLFVILLIMLAYLIFRFHYYGWFFGLVGVQLAIAPLFFFSLFNYTFTYLLWFTILLVLTLHVYQSSQFFGQYAGQPVQNILGNPQVIKRLVIRSLIQNSLLIGAGLGYAFFGDMQFQSLGVYLGLVGLFSVVVYALIYGVWSFIIKHPGDHDLEFMMYQNKRIFSYRASPHFWYRSIGWGLMSVIVLLSLYNVVSGIGLNYNAIYKTQSVVVIPDGRPDIYLEMEAELLTRDLSQHESKYEISEQAGMWLYFDAMTNQERLHEAVSSFSERTQMPLVIFRIEPQVMPSRNPISYWILGLTFGLVSIMTFLLTRKDQAVLPLMMRYSLAGIFFVLFSWLLQINWGLESIYSLSFVIYLYATILTNLELKPQLKQIEKERSVVDMFFLSAVIYAMFMIPILVIIPTAATFLMARSFLVVFAAIILSEWIVTFKFKLKRK